MKYLSALLIALTTQQAMALNLQGYRFSDSYRYSILDDSYKEKFKGKYVFTGSLGYINSPLYLSDKDVTLIDREIINHQYVLTAGASYYINSDWSVGLDLNAIHNEVVDESYTSLADTVIKAKWNLYRSSLFSFALNPKLYLPTGKTDNFSTINSLGASLAGIGEMAYKQWHFLGSLGFFHGGNNKFSVIDYRNLVLLQLGVSYDLNAAWNINAETVRNFTTGRDYRQDEGDYYLTFKNKTHHNFSTFFGAGVAGVDKIDRNNYSVFAGVKIYNGEEKLKAVIPQPAPAPVKKPVIKNRDDEKKLGAVTKMDDIYFPNGASTLLPIEKVKLDEVLALYSSNKGSIRHIVIEGYASKVGNKALNLRLSQERAGKVKTYLMDGGIPGETLSVVAYGDSTPQDQAEWKNRKVQFRVYR